MKWFTSDLHFAHPFVAALRGYALPGYARDESIKQQAEHDGRQLKDCVDWRKHDADIIQAINTYVGQEDELYILGDISSGSTWSVDQAIMRIQNLQVPRKRRHLILGNHEMHSSSRTLEKLASVFGEVGRVGITEIRDGWGNNPHTVFSQHLDYVKGIGRRLMGVIDRLTPESLGYREATCVPHHSGSQRTCL